MSDDEKPLGYIVDQETRVDLLRNEAIAKVVVKLIRSRADTSVTIGVHGDWGAGKSSVLNMIEAEFEEGAGPAAGDSLCIRVNGWEYQGFEDAKIALIESVVTQLVESRGTYAKVKETFGSVRDSIDWLKATKRIGGLAFDLATGLPVATIATVVGSAMSAPGELMTRENAEAAAAEVKGVLKEGGAPSKTVPQELNEFRAAFAQLLSDAKIRRLVVLVDDLDRCLPETAIQTLEAIRLFVSLPKTAFVVGADERMIEYAVRQHFKDLPDEEAYRGYPRAYLEKLIQVPFRIPSLGEAETRIYVTMMLVGSLVDESGDPFTRLLERARARMSEPWKRVAIEDSDLRVAFGEHVPPEVAEAAATAAEISPVLAQGTKGNPRLIKRFLNALMLRLAISDARGFGDAIKPAVLAKIMLAELYLPTTVFAHMGASAAASDDGRCAEVEQMESAVRKGREQAASDGNDDDVDGPEVAEGPPGEGGLVTAWTTDPDILRWAAVEPAIGSLNLRPYLFVVNDRHSFVEGAKPMSEEVRSILDRLLAGGMQARGPQAKLKSLKGAEVELVFRGLKSKLLTENTSGKAPAVVEGLLALVAAHPAYELRLVETAEQIAPKKLGGWAATKFDVGVTTPAARARLAALKAKWTREGSEALKRALKHVPVDGGAE